MLRDKVILVTGGTGSFGNTFVPMTLAKYNPKKIIIFSRDEMKQWDMAKKFEGDKPRKWGPLKSVWQLLGDKEKFMDYVALETRKVIDEV